MGFDPLCCDVFGNIWKSTIEKHFVTGKPYMYTDIGWRVPTERVTSWGTTNDEGFFLGTYDVPNTPEAMGNRTAHRCFWTYKAAKRYSERMRSGCLTAKEWQHAKSWAEFRDDLHSMSAYIDDYDYGCDDSYAERVDFDDLEEEMENDEHSRI